MFLHVFSVLTACTLCLFPCSVSQQNGYYEACDNIYEDVENINKLILGHSSREQRGSLKSTNV